MGHEDSPDFLDMVEMKQGHIQQEFENLSDLVMNNDEIEILEDPSVIIEFAVSEALEFIRRLKRFSHFIRENN